MTPKITLLLLAALALPALAQDHHGIDPTSIDATVKPGDDFYHYADGTWIKQAEIPADRAGLSVFVFPEGARTPHGDLQNFLNGAAYLAIRGQVPLVPIALIGVHDLLPPHTRHFYPSPTPIRLIFGTPIPTAGRTLRESEALTAELRQAIADLIQKHR